MIECLENRASSARSRNGTGKSRTCHIDGSVSARYAHVTPGMRERLKLGSTEQWETALDTRLATSPTSPVRVLGDFLRARRESRTSVEHQR
ncbi:hypothetical protein GCM10010421_50870 [Streptomyces glaucus]|uniref:Uncharacterized protein n=1 Tax=Streptomyces glaucus TaxID=284029 RepID=A0ABN3K8H5_9ACTN